MASDNNRVSFLNFPIDSLTSEHVIDKCLSWCRGDRCSHTIITVNAAIMTMMRKDKQLHAACAAGDLILADGMSVIWASRLAATPLLERVTGIDLVDSLLDKASQSQMKVFFLGAREPVVSKLVEICREKHPGLIVAGYRNGYFKDEQHAEIVRQIRASKADMLFVGMPSPFKEVWCEKYRDELHVPLIMGVGGSFDVLAGFVDRAPQWLQKIGMEWFWRLLMEPGKMWKRYLVTNSVFIRLSVSWIIRQRLFTSFR